MHRLSPEGFIAVLETTAPFSVLLDGEGVILFAGSAMCKVVPEAQAGGAFATVFATTRPAEPGAFFADQPGMRFFHDRRKGLRFKGTVRRLDGGLVLLAANPVINADQTISKLGLTVRDLPPHDTIAEYAFLQQTYHTALDEARQGLTKAREQSEALRAVIDSSVDQIVVVDDRGRVVRWNRKAATFHGIPEHEAMGRELGALLLKGRDAANWARLVRRLRDDPTSPLLGKGFEFEMQDHTGRAVPLELRFSMVGAGDQFLRINAHDLSERINNELDIRQREAHYRSIITNMDLGLLVVDREERILSANASMARMLGLSEADLVGRTTMETIRFADPKMGPVLRETAEAKREQGLSSAWEVAIRRPSGEVRHLLVSGAPRYDTGGAMVGSIGIHLDITDRIHLNAELERSRNWFRALVANLPGATFLEQLQPDAQTLFFSEYVQHISGYPAEWYITGAVDRHQSVHPDDAARVRKELDKALAAESDHTLEYRVLRTDGKLLWVREVGRYYREGERLMLTGNLFNISAERKAQELADLNARMIEALAGATAALLESGDVLEGIGTGMRLVGSTLGVDRISLFRIGYTGAEAATCGPVLKWLPGADGDHLLREQPWQAPWEAFGPLGVSTLQLRSYTTRQEKERHAGLRSFMEVEGVSRLMSLPLRTGAGVWGFLCLDMLGDGDWRADSQTATLEAYASAVSESLERERINADRLLDLEVEKAINSMALGMLGHRTENSLLWDLVERVAVELGLEHCVVYRMDEERGCLVPRAAWRDGARSDSFAASGPALWPGTGVVGTVMRTHLPERVDDTAADPRYIPDERPRASELVVPILFGDRLLGVINSENDRHAFYGTKHQRTLETVAAMLSAQLIRLEEQERSEQERMMKGVLQERLNAELEAALVERNRRLLELEAMSRYADSNPNPVMRFSKDGVLQYANNASAALLDAYGMDVGKPVPGGLFTAMAEHAAPITVPCGKRIFELMSAPVPEFGFINVYGTDVTPMHQLRDAQEELILQERLSALGRLTAGVAHEINSPLGAVVGSAQNMDLLLQDLLDEELPRIDAAEQGVFVELLAEPLLSPPHGELQARAEYVRERLRAVAPPLASGHWPGRIAEMGWGARPGEPWERLLELPGRERLLSALGTVAAVRESLRTVRFAAERATKVVQALRNYMHQDDERRVAEFDLARQLRMVATLFSASGRKGVRFVQDLPESTPFKGVEDELAQVWTNVMSNALQAVGEVGHIGVSLSTATDRVEVRITNTGPRIPPEVLSRIYEPMFTTKKKGEGTGIGLSIVKRIVDTHGGSVECISTDEQTCFTIVLPCT